MNKIGLYVSITIVIFLFGLIGTANAVPHYSSKYEKKCSYCHTAWPQLNAKGRAFRERGYRMKEDLKEDLGPITELGSFPISALVQSRPYDKKDSGERKMRALQEIELFIGGAVTNNVSAFFEIEAEDENGFAPDFANMALSIRINDYANFHLTYAPSIWADSYGFLGSQFRLTRDKVGITDDSYGGADGGAKMRSRRQNFEFSGRADRVFYSAGISGEADDYEGVNAKGYSGRLAFDITKNIMVGAFTMGGDTQAKPESAPGEGDATVTRKFSRTGIDFQADFMGSRIQAAYLQAKDDTVDATAEATNNAFSLQYYFTAKTKTGSPTLVPLMRIDSYQKNDGNDDYVEMTLHLTYFITENFKTFIEYWDQVSVPDNASKPADNRTTWQLAVNF